MSEVTPPSHRSLVDRNVLVPMRDGTLLATDFYRPDTEVPVATILQRTPYDKSVATFYNFTLEIGRVVEAGYAVVVQDVRGRFLSEGEFEPFADEGADGADTVAWIKRQAWSNGRVGMFGASYYGLTQWLAVEAGAAVDAIAPGLSSPSVRDGWAYQGGGFQLGFTLNWAASVLAPAEILRRVAAGAGDMADLGELVAFVDDDRTAYGQTPLDGSELISRVAPYYGDWLHHPEPDAYWDRVAPATASPTTVPTLSIGGWYDIFLKGTIAGHAAASSGSECSRLVIGPWAHANMTGQYPQRNFGFGSHYQALDPTGMHLRMFDEHLRGAEHAKDAPVLIFVMGADEWRELPSWPPSDVEYRALYLGRGEEGIRAPRAGRLCADVDMATPGAVVYRYDPADPVPTLGGATFLPGLLVSANSGPWDQQPLDARDDILTFTSDPLDADLEVIGPVQMVLHVSSDAPDTDFTAKLMDVDAAGAAVILADGLVRMRYRDGVGIARSMVAGRVYEVRIDLVATANRFRRGHRIRVDVSSSNFPKYDRNLNTGGANAREHLGNAVVAENGIHLGVVYPSRIILPVVPTGMRDRDE